jgi:glycosyltransferase involved in cell wall biosynthesis
MPFFYNSLSTYVYFSDHEGCNRTIIEAAACGLPIVSTDAGAVRELLDPEWIIEGDPEKSVKAFSDKVRILKEDGELRQKVGQENRERVHRWSWERITRDLEEIWKNLLGEI